MKKLLIILSATIFIIADKASAQCNFTATITPKNPILCPNSSDTLYTERADAYQWLKNNNPIAGANKRYLIVHQNDVGSLIKVASTRNGCTDTSKRVLIDSYVFLLPYFIHSGDQGTYDPELNASVLCPKDTLILTLGSPYTENVQWYNAGKPIPGANKQSYYVTQNGSYTACGAPAVCPNYIACQNLAVNVVFDRPEARITERNDTLFANNSKTYQWFLFGKRILNATRSFYVPKIKGRYTVMTTDKYNCSAMSDAYTYNPGENVAQPINRRFPTTIIKADQ